MMKLLLATAALAASIGAANASVVFHDHFNGETKTTNSAPSQWNVTSGSVDTIGTDYFDFYPGNGSYLDMNGSTWTAGRIETKFDFVIGKTYTLSFDFGYNTNSGYDFEELSFGIGNKWGSIGPRMLATAGTQLKSARYTFKATGTKLFFADTGTTPDDNGGPVLDNVKVSAVPLPASAVLLLAGLGGMALLRRRRRA